VFGIRCCMLSPQRRRRGCRAAAAAADAAAAIHAPTHHEPTHPAHLTTPSPFLQGYSRKGAALHSLKRYEEAASAYDAGLGVAPTDAGLLSGKADVDKILSAQAPAGLFGPEIYGKLAADPKLSKRLGEPGFLQKVQMLQSNPQALSTMMGDPDVQVRAAATLLLLLLRRYCCCCSSRHGLLLTPRYLLLLTSSSSCRRSSPWASA